MSNFLNFLAHLFRTPPTAAPPGAACIRPATKPPRQWRRCILTYLYLGIVTVLAGNHAARALPLPSYDLGSLAYLAQDIATARVVWSKNGGASLKITRVYTGRLTPGHKIGINCWLYEVEGVRHDQGPLRVGDKLFVFLDPNRMLLPSGIKLIAQGRVYSFVQWINPGGYLGGPGVPWSPGRPARGWLVSIKRFFGWHPPKPLPPTLAQFVRKLKASIAESRHIHAFFRTASNPSQLPRLLALVKGCPKDYGVVVASAAAERIASFRQPGPIFQTLPICRSINGRAYYALLAGLGTPAGRKLWLARSLSW